MTDPSVLLQELRQAFSQAIAAAAAETQAPFTLPVPLHHPCCDPCSCCTHPATCRSTVTTSASFTASPPASVSVTVPVTAFVISEWKHAYHILVVWCCCYSFNCTCGRSCGACCKGPSRRPLTEPTKARHLLHPCFFIRWVDSCCCVPCETFCWIVCL